MLEKELEVFWSQNNTGFWILLFLGGNLYKLACISIVIHWYRIIAFINLLTVVQGPYILHLFCTQIICSKKISVLFFLIKSFFSEVNFLVKIITTAHLIRLISVCTNYYAKCLCNFLKLLIVYRLINYI